MKQTTLSPLGKQLANMKDDSGKAFDQIKNIVFLVAGLPKWKEDVKVLHYRKLVMGVVRQKDQTKRKEFILSQIKPWVKLYNAFRDDILKEDLSFLSDENEEPIRLMTGNSKNAVLPLGEVYIHLLKHDADQSDDLQAKLFLTFRHLVGEQSSDRKILNEICEQFELAEDIQASNAISSIVEKVRSFNTGNNGNQPPSMENIMPVVQAIFQDGGINSGMGQLAEAVMSGKMSIPDLIGTVQKNVKTVDQKDAEAKILQQDESDSED